MTIKQAKELDLVDYLSALGHAPQRVSGKNHWYLSPLRQEKTASFKINRTMNRWYDFADGRGGDLVDFGTLYHGCSVSDFLKMLSIPDLSAHQYQRQANDSSTGDEELKKIKILSVHAVSSFPLVRYLQSRRIPDTIASQYLKEIRYQIGDKKFYALGFKNDAGGYELRNENFKGSSSPKDITFFDNKAKDLAIFEGFFNFLSHRAMHYNQEAPASNFLVLNSTSFFEKSIPKMQEHAHVHLYLDNDKTGQKFTELALALDKQTFTDERRLYQQYNDLNHWLTHIGQSQRQQLMQKP